VIHVDAVDFVSVPTRDVARTTAFYRDALGLPPGASGEVETPNVTLSFSNPEEDGEAFAPILAGVALRAANVRNTLILHRRYAPRA
jgi:catechol 2,3-dioxygenase-like lactoylglutathione lyase family enzyme